MSSHRECGWPIAYCNTTADDTIIGLLTTISTSGGSGGGSGGSPAGSVGDIQTKASSSTFGSITPGTGVATALAVNVGSAGAPVVLNGAGGTPSSLTLTNATGLPVAGITASTSTALGVGSIELGAASDTTITRSGAGAVQVEGVQVLLSGAALGTPASGTLTNCSGTAASLTSGITNALKSATTTVDVSAATAPSANQVLTATDSTHATWVAPAAHGVYAGASPPTTDVGFFVIAVTGIDLKNAGTTTVFTVPTSRTFIAQQAWAIVTAVTGAGAGTQTFNITCNTAGTPIMTNSSASGSTTPVVGKTLFASAQTGAGGPYAECPAGNIVQVAVATSHAGSTTVTGTVFVSGFYAT